MTKAQPIAYWVETADDNRRSIQNMVSVGEYVPALFWAHLTVEKLSKAVWVQDNEGNTPPRIHNIVKLLAATTFVATEEQRELA